MKINSPSQHSLLHIWSDHINCLFKVNTTNFYLNSFFQPTVCRHQPAVKTVTCDTEPSYSWPGIVYQTSQAIKEEIIKFDVIKLWLVWSSGALELSWVPLNNVNNSGAVLRDRT